MSNIGMSPATSYEKREAVSAVPSFAAVATGFNEALSRLGALEETSESIISRLVGSTPKAELDPPNAPSPYGALPELMASLQTMHARLSRIEKNLVAISNTLP